MLVSAQIWSRAIRAGPAPSVAFARSSWCLTRALRRVPPAHSLSLGAGAGSAEPGRQWEGNPPSPSPGRGEFPHRLGEMFVPTKSGLRPPAAPLPRGEGGGRCEAAGPRFLPPGREGPGQGRAEPRPGAPPAPPGLQGSPGKGAAGPKGSWWGLKSPSCLRGCGERKCTTASVLERKHDKVTSFRVESTCHENTSVCICAGCFCW